MSIIRKWGIQLKDSDVKRIIKYAIRADAQDADKLANDFFNKAVIHVGRTLNVDFNRKWVTFNLVASQGSYVLGKDIMAEMSDIMNAQSLYSTDNVQPIVLMELDKFRNITGGLTASGRPTHATIHSANKTLELYPTPDGTYEYGLYVRRYISRFEDIPEAYHDVVADTGVMMVKAIDDPQIAVMLAQQGRGDMQNDNVMGWSGSTVRASRGLDRGGGLGADSGNLRGDL